MISKPVDHRLLIEDVLIVRDSEADPDPVIGMRIESVGRHSKKAKSGSQSLPDFAYTNKRDHQFVFFAERQRRSRLTIGFPRIVFDLRS
jgi:hypothetical protein